MKSPETEAEARVRDASFLYRLGDYRQAIGLLRSADASIAGHGTCATSSISSGARCFAALGRPDEAAAAFRAALRHVAGRAVGSRGSRS